MEDGGEGREVKNEITSHFIFTHYFMSHWAADSSSCMICAAVVLCCM